MCPLKDVSHRLYVALSYQSVSSQRRNNIKIFHKENSIKRITARNNELLDNLKDQKGNNKLSQIEPLPKGAPIPGIGGIKGRCGNY